VANGNTINAPGTSLTPIQIARFHMLGGIGKTNFWFDTSAFCQPTPSPVQDGSACSAVAVPNGTLGNVAHYAFAGPNFFNIDAGLTRRIPLTERIGFEFRMDALNATNTPQFDLPTVDMTSNNFGHVTGTAGANRTVALGAKVGF
jgi:hypothetical protein